MGQGTEDGNKGGGQGTERDRERDRGKGTRDGETGIGLGDRGWGGVDRRETGMRNKRRDDDGDADVRRDWGLTRRADVMTDTNDCQAME